MTYQIIFTKQPNTFINRQDRHIATRLISKIRSSLSENPVPHNAKALSGHPGTFRIRIGQYRASYTIDYTERRVVVFEIDKRSRAYDF